MVDRIAGYVVTGTLGKGGFGEVLAAQHDVLGRDVAIKVLHARWSDDGDAVRRFVSEARAVNAVRHPNIVDVFDFGTLDDGRHYHVMERLRGESLHARLAARVRLPLDEALPILRAIAGALDAAHDAGVVHRDVKPENVFLHEDAGREVAKLIDFGLAKLIAPTSEGPTQSGVILGTPAYMAPEQCRGVPIDHRADVYAFGVVAYEMLTGSVPHRGADPVATLLAHVHEATEPPSRRTELPHGVDEIVLTLLAKHPDQRPARLLPVVEALAAVASGTTLPATRPRSAMPISVAAIAVGAIVIAGVVLFRDSEVPPAVVPIEERRDTIAPAEPARPPSDAPVIEQMIDAGTRRTDVRLPAARADAGRGRPNPEEPENPYAR